MKGLSASQTPDLVVKLRNMDHKKVEDTRIEPSLECMVENMVGWGVGIAGLDYRLQ